MISGSNISGQRVAIIGAGIAGLSHAIALLRLGAKVTVFEQAPALGEVGAALQISENGAKALDYLGVYEAVAAKAQRSDVVEMFDYRADRPLLRIPFEQLRPNYRQARIMRWDLIEVLYDAAMAAGADVQFNCPLRGATMEGEVALHGRDPQQFDLIIGADGVNSVLRPVLNPHARPKFTQQIAWRTMVPHEAGDAHVRVVLAPHRHLVLYSLPQGDLNVVAVQESATWAQSSWRATGQADEFKTLFADFHPTWTGLLGRASYLYKWGLHLYEEAEVTHKGKIILVGDAAHPTLPFMAQGACLALEGAVILARALTAAPWQEGFAIYESLHMPRARLIVREAEKNGESFHLPEGIKRSAMQMALSLAQLTGGRAVIGRWDWIYGYDVGRVPMPATAPK